MSSHAYTILTALIQSIGGGVPRSHLTSLSELLHACILRLPQESNLALKELMARQGFPTEKAGKETKEKFLKAVLKLVFFSFLSFFFLGGEEADEEWVVLGMGSWLELLCRISRWFVEGLMEVLMGRLRR